jgi:hypothetical protein
LRELPDSSRICNRDHGCDRKPIRINRDPFLIAEPDHDFSGKIDSLMFSTEQKKEMIPESEHLTTMSRQNYHIMIDIFFGGWNF